MKLVYFCPNCGVKFIKVKSDQEIIEGYTCERCGMRLGYQILEEMK